METLALSPRQAFEDNMRPAELLLRVYRLLECETLQTDGDLVRGLRAAMRDVARDLGHDEEVMLIYNEIFIGLVRERAQIPPSALKRAALKNLLRQAIVAACTGLDAYLPALLRTNLPTVISARGRDFFPQDTELQEFFAELKFDLAETLRLLNDPEAPFYIANKILGLTKFKYLSSKKGIFAVGALLSIEKPWDQIAAKLQRDRKELMKIIDETATRRNDIVHRADRPQTDPGGDIQDVSYSWSQQSVDTIKHVCLALDELVVERMVQLQAREL